MSTRKSERLRKKQIQKQVQLAEVSMNQDAEHESDHQTDIRGIEENVSTKEDNHTPKWKGQHAYTSSKGKVRSVTSSVHRQILQEELETARKRNAIEEKREKRQKELLDLELALKVAQIEDNNSISDQVLDHLEERYSTGECSQSSRIQKWINNQQSQHQDIENRESCHDDNAKCSTKVNLCQIDNINTGNKLQSDNYLERMLIRQSIPKDLPSFDGNPSDWPNFISQYTSTTKMCGYSNEENQTRLQKSLKGRAREIVQTLLILPKNVDKVMDLLEKRFGRPEYIIDNILEKIRNIPCLREEKFNSIVEFSDTIRNLVGTMLTLEQEDHLRNPLLLQDLVSKLPNRLRLEWTRKTKSMDGNKPKLVEFQDWLEELADDVCQLQNPFPNPPGKYEAKPGVFLRSSIWMNYKNIMPAVDDTSSVLFCAVSSAFTQYFYTATWIWTLCYALDMRRILSQKESRMKFYHLAAWALPAISTTTGLSLLYFPDANCHTNSSLKSTFLRILPNYVATYIPIATIMVANPCLYRHSIKDMERIITTTSGQFTSRERDLIDTVKLKFSVINIVFYICWVPNLLNGLLLWTLWFHLPVKCIIVIWYIMALLNPLQALFNCLVYRRWSSGSERVILPWRQLEKTDSSPASRTSSRSSKTDEDTVRDETYPLLYGVPTNSVNLYQSIE